MVGKTLFLAIVLVLFAHTFARRNGNLLSVAQVYRHGERAPVYFYPTDPYQDFSYWNATEGQLTNTGKQQHFRLGQYTRRRYSDFLPELYSNEDFLVRSTNMDRTYMSAESNVAGLYPPVDYQVWNPSLDWQPIPVFPLDEAILNPSSDCTRYNTLVQEKITELFLENQEEYADILEYVGENTGLNLTNLYYVLMVWDALFIENQKGYQLPEWTESVFPDPLTYLTSLFYWGISSTEELKILSTGVFFNTIIEQFESIIADSSSVQKYQQFSAHDTNVAAILNSLGAYNASEIPGFASTIYFELRSSSDQNYINIYYSNFSGVTPVPVTVAGCDFNCDLEDFKNILANITITADEWYDLCDA